MEEFKKIKFSIRSIFLFEELTKKTFEIQTNMDLYIYFYCCLIAGKEYARSFDEFVDECDLYPEAIKWFTSELEKHNRLNSQFESEESGETKKKSD